MALPYPLLFLALLAAYMLYSAWAGLDARLPVAAAVVLIAASAVADATGRPGAANTFLEYAFFLLAAGVVLLVIDRARRARAGTTADGPSAGTVAPMRPPPEAVQELHPAAEQPLDRPE